MLSERIKTARTNAGLKKSEVSKILKMPYTTYDSYERGKSNPSFNVLLELSILFKVSLDYLLDIEPPRTVNPSETVSEKEKRLHMNEGTLSNSINVEYVRAKNKEDVFYIMDNVNIEGQEKIITYAKEIENDNRYKKQSISEIWGINPQEESEQREKEE